MYCTILLLILVCSLYDFSGNWFEDRWGPRVVETTTSVLGSNATITRIVDSASSFAASAINQTDGSLAGMAVEGVKRKAGLANASGPDMNLFEWLRNASEKVAFRIPCVNVRVTL